MDSILFERKGPVGKIILNRPKVYNSFNREMALELQQKLDECERDEAIRVIFLTGNGKAFSAGQDLQEIIAEDGPSISDILSKHYNPIIQKIRSIKKPFIAAVNGVAAGAGANIALACDIVVVTASASFIQAFSKIGLIPDSGGTFFLPRIIGFQKANALMMLGDKVSAQEALTLGMVYKVFEEEEFEEKAFQLTEKLGHMPTTALGLIKTALNHSLNNSLEEQLKLEDQLQQMASSTEDYEEGVKAFLEKRKPIFKGK